MIAALATLLLTVTVPPPTSRIVDQAGLLSAEQRTQVQAIIDRVEEKTGTELAVLTVASVPGGTPKEFATEVFNSWGIGKKGADNGVLVMVSIGDRRVEIETGYGVESILTDGRIGQVLDNHVVPHFKGRRFGDGIVAGVGALAGLLTGDTRTVALMEHATDDAGAVAGRPGSSSPITMGMLLIFTAILLLLMFTGSRNARWVPWVMWLSLFVGLGAPTIWLMESGPHWLMFLCALALIGWAFLAVKFKIGTRRCPMCELRAINRTTKTQQAATYSAGGLELVTDKCTTRGCDYKNSFDRFTARLVRSSTSSGSSSWSSSSSSSSWSSSSSSSSSSYSSSSSSFGGGSSGGGGSGRSW